MSHKLINFHKLIKAYKEFNSYDLINIYKVNKNCKKIGKLFF